MLSIYISNREEVVRLHCDHLFSHQTDSSKYLDEAYISHRWHYSNFCSTNRIQRITNPLWQFLVYYDFSGTLPLFMTSLFSISVS
mmetsp:Transcript_17548/g.42196  ORF Transcript_17548/g.42196 Transcript_17548/m.42196 type:complete len:85 (-) Transcript_17548:601-855(-)